MSTATLEVPIQNEALNQQIEHKQFGQLWPQYKIDNGSGRKIGVIFGNEVVELLVDHPCWLTPLADLETWYSRLRLKSKFVAPTFPAPTPAYSHPVRWDMPLAYTRYDVSGLTPVSPRTAKALAIEAGVRLFYLENEHKHWLAARPAIEQSRADSVLRQLAYNTGKKLHLPCPAEVLDRAMRATISKTLGDMAKDTPVSNSESDVAQELDPAKDFTFKPSAEEIDKVCDPLGLSKDTKEDKEGREEQPVGLNKAGLTKAQQDYFDRYKSDHFKECLGASWLALLESANFHLLTNPKEAERFATGVAARQCRAYKKQLLTPLYVILLDENGKPVLDENGKSIPKPRPSASVIGQHTGEQSDGGFDAEEFPDIREGGRFERARSGRGPYGQVQSPCDPIVEGTMVPRDTEQEQPFWDVLTAFEDFHPAEYQWLIDYYSAKSNNTADRAKAVKLRTQIADTVKQGTLCGRRPGYTF